ncbi:cellulose binding domain-containing protein [Cellvibrio japonicus]|uniref:Carbohydrate binding protein, putative, cbp2C n=1 Tax=Cellvibrio japonicus (strain Ueda107) TaxID=498211 RepID=B3PDE9_CELJU|nr:cellulose binding domain-containing protein [Cellvibrio japonicus]ACE82894.1 carbohydrate binding protein, putative, cbp2C [Cellvibrio japonicus Ueda107]QEI13398.1 sugar-binding protein [Cellvibrio japonicus]QEI16972.1 sugar-binding protein [Cellvibrio japonicus]QEI20550.1 sugar-binding protein [Cellvibrio japonicus]
MPSHCIKAYRLKSLIALGILAASGYANAACQYVITNAWGSGFTAAIRITNDTASAVNSWQVSWSYTRNSVTNAWNAQLSGNYSASNLNWNGNIQPGQTVEFGLQGSTNGGSLEAPAISGALCSSSAQSSQHTISSSLASSSIQSATSSSALAAGNNIAPLATASTSYVSPWETLSAVNDNNTPANSNDKTRGAYGNWNNPNSIQWVQYDWPQPYTLGSTQIYWFDDNGGVLTPTRAYIEYWNGSSWINAGNVPLAKNAFNTLALNNIVTNRLRVSMLNTQQSTGILEWRVSGTATGGSTSSISSSIPSSSSSTVSSSLSSSRSSQSSSVLSSSVISSSSSLISSSRSSVASSSASSSAPAVFPPITNQYEYEGINTGNAVYKDSNRFRLYYGADNRRGPKGNLGTHSEADVTRLLEHMEKVYDYFIGERGFKSPAQSVHASRPGLFKINLYSVTDIDAGGFMGYNGTAGLSFLVIRSNLLNAYNVSTHEFGHSITLAEYVWVDKARTGAWWETTAEWFADTFMGPITNSTNFDANSLHADSRLSIVHRNNLYQAWPFMTYLTSNPDNYPGLGRDAVRNLIRQHQGQETPLHSLARLTQPVSIQTLVGRYRARMAYADIGHPLAQQRLFSAQRDASFRARAYRNLEAVDSSTYRVLATRRPQYTGSNITPLQATGSGLISIQVTNLGNGLNDSNFTATVAIKAANNSVRYVDLANGSGNFQLSSGEEASLVVTNTPDNLYLYNAFDSTDTSPESIGLNYQVQILGARPRD